MSQGIIEHFEKEANPLTKAVLRSMRTIPKCASMMHVYDYLRHEEIKRTELEEIRAEATVAVKTVRDHKD